jgi:hypothetical protein
VAGNDVICASTSWYVGTRIEVFQLFLTSFKEK